MNEAQNSQDSFLMLILTELKSDIREVKADVKETRDKVSDLELHISTALTENSIIARQNEQEIEELKKKVEVLETCKCVDNKKASFDFSSILPFLSSTPGKVVVSLVSALLLYLFGGLELVKTVLTLAKNFI